MSEGREGALSRLRRCSSAGIAAAKPPDFERLTSFAARPEGQAFSFTLGAGAGFGRLSLVREG